MRYRVWLIAILILAAALRLVGLERGDPMNDEVTYAFRAVGLADSFNDPSIQMTTWEELDPDIPGWTRLSFHDHPPLVIWIQHLAMRLLGETMWAARLPSAILGVGSAALLFAITRRIASPQAGLIASALFAVTLNAVYASRSALQEPYVVFFVLAAILFFLKALDRPRWFVASGAAIGLGLLAKYTAAVFFPIAGTYLLLFRRNLFRNGSLWLGALLALAVASPIIIYNALLFRTTGHFDLQLSYLAGRLPEAWQYTAGKDIGSPAERAQIFLPRLWFSHSWLFLTLAAASAAGFFGSLIRAPARTSRRHAITVLALVFGALLVLATGPSFRFLALLTPFLAIAAGCFLAQAGERLRSFFPTAAPFVIITVIVIIAAFEAAYAVNNQIAYYPAGPRPWFASPLRYENFNWGHNELDRYLAGELAGKIPALTFEPRYQFVRDLQERRIARSRERGSEPYPALFVIYANLDLAPELWILHRRLMHDGWPIMTLDEYREAFGSDPASAGRAGFRHQYVILQSSIVPTPEFRTLTSGADPIPVVNPRGEKAFWVYPVTQFTSD